MSHSILRLLVGQVSGLPAGFQPAIASQRLAPLFLLFQSLSLAATFGTAVPIVGGATDLVLDERRSRLYIVNSTQNRIEVYSTTQRRFLNAIPVDNLPLAAAISRNGQFLFVTSYNGALLDMVDLDAATVVRRVSLPAAPEGVAVGGDERVLITTTGSGTNNAENRLLLFDPYSEGSENLRAVPTTLPPPAPPQVPAPSSRVFMSTRSNLAVSQDGRWIIGLNNPNNTIRQVFVFEVESGSVLRSRSLTSVSNVLSVSPDGSKFMAGLSLFETRTLAIIAQQNAANSMHPFQNNVNFNTQQNQGGSVFAPDGGILYTAFNTAPVQNPAAPANITQLMLNDPDHLLIRLALQLPENLTGNIVIHSSGETAYALSQSGFLILPLSAIYESPLAVLDEPVALLTNDQCGVTADTRKVSITVRNGGRGRMTATAQVMEGGLTFTFPIAPGGPGGGAPGGAPVIVLPPGVGGITQSAPTLVTRRTETETTFEFTFNANAARSLGTIAPTDFLVQSTEAINVPWRIRVYQNHRNAEALGQILPVAVSVSTAEGPADLVLDEARRRLYIANSGMNRIEVFDTEANRFLSPIKVGQLPRSIAMTPSGRLLYVANTGGESVSIIDLDLGEIIGKVKFPPVPYNASFALNTPSVVASTLSGLQIVMSDGSLWKAVNNEALPRGASAAIGTTTIQAPRSLVATPGGEYALLLGGNGTAYLFDAMADDFVLSQSVVTTPIQGYFGPVAAGPRGQYFVVNGTLLNQALTPMATGSVTSGPVAAVAAVSATTMTRFVQPTRANANAVVTSTPFVQLVDVTTGAPRGTGAALEGPLSAQVGTQRVNVGGRTMAVDSTGSTAYVLTTAGLSIVALTTLAQGPPQPGGAAPSVPVINQNGVVNGASLQPGLAPGMQFSIFGQNLASQGSSQGTPLPTVMGGACVTLDDVPLPLLMTSGGQINLQLPADVRTGSHTLVVRSIEKNAASPSRTLTVAKYAPAAYVNPETGQVALFHGDGRPVTKSDKARRDEPLTMFATGLGVTQSSGATDKVQVYFGDTRMSQAEVIVDSSGLAPGPPGVYQLFLRVPGNHLRGDELPVTIRIGAVSSTTSGSAVPTVAVE